EYAGARPGIAGDPNDGPAARGPLAPASGGSRPVIPTPWGAEFQAPRSRTALARLANPFDGGSLPGPYGPRIPARAQGGPAPMTSGQGPGPLPPGGTMGSNRPGPPFVPGRALPPGGPAQQASPQAGAAPPVPAPGGGMPGMEPGAIAGGPPTP